MFCFVKSVPYYSVAFIVTIVEVVADGINAS